MISAPFASLLASGRPGFNRRVAEARRRYPGFDTAAFGSFLSTAADAVVSAVAAHAPDRAGPAALAVFDLALELTAHKHTGTLARQVWIDVAPHYASLLAQQPAVTLGMLTNAVLHMQKVRGVRVTEWLDWMAQLAPQTGTLQQLSVCGQICAWRAGMVHFRQGAIAAAEQLPEALALAAFGATEGEWPEVRDALLRDPWWTPEAAVRKRAAAGIEVGSFTGFGGGFSEPPEVRPAQQGFWVRSGERHALLMADACGAVLHPASADEYAHSQPAANATVSIEAGGVVLNGRRTPLDLPVEGLKVVCSTYAAALTSPYSHAIRVLPLR